MKNSIFNFTALAFTLGIISCSTGFDKQSIYEQIAKDETYEILHESMSELALLVVSDQINLDALTQHVHENSNGTGTICDKDDEALKQIKGGLEYKLLNCKMRQSMNTLKEKYPEYADFSKSDIRQLRNAYQKQAPSSTEITPSVILQNHIRNN